MRPFTSNSLIGGGGQEYRENRHVVFVRTFASIMSNFQDKVNSVILTCEDINLGAEELKNCPYDKERFQECLDRVQRGV